METSGPLCSVSIAVDGKLIAVSNGDGENDHAAQLTNLISQILQKNNFLIQNVDAIAVSGGPGSYTGLRIGTSTAKGICHALNIPLIAVNTLRSMAQGIAKQYDPAFLFCPVTDARRMEIFTAIYSGDGMEFLPPCAMIIDENSFLSFLSSHKIVFWGSGVNKVRATLKHENALFKVSHIHTAADLIPESYELWQKRQFADLNYFEPYYLKEVYTTTPVK